MSESEDRSESARPTGGIRVDGPKGLEDLDSRWIKVIDAALAAQAPIADNFVARQRVKHPEADDDALMETTFAMFKNLVTVTGAGAGGSAALPGLGTAAALGVITAEGVAFAEACAFLTVSAASIYGVDMRDAETRQMVMLAVLGGENGTRIITKALGQSGLQWSTVLSGNSSNIVVRAVNQRVRKWLVRKVATRTGGLMLGKLLPFGIGALIGGYGNRAVARSVAEAVREIFAHVPRTVSGTARETGGSEITGA